MKKLILSACFASLLTVGGAYAQTDTTTTTTTATSTDDHGKKDKDKDKDKDKEKDKNKEQVKTAKPKDEVKSTETTKTTTTTGTVEEFVPGESVLVRTEAAEPVRFRLSKEVVYVNGAGKVIEASAVRKSARVHYHFIQEGGVTVVDRIIVD